MQKVMRRSAWLASLGAFTLLFACASEEQAVRGPDPAEEFVRHLFAVAWNTGDISGLDAALAADSVLFHYRGSSAYTSLAELEGLISHWRSAFPDLHMELLDLVSDTETLAARVRYSGTHEGVWFGIPPTGRSINVDEMMFFRFEDGRLVELWEVDDQLSMRTQLGVIN